jgi:hypothetical protein
MKLVLVFVLSVLASISVAREHIANDLLQQFVLGVNAKNITALEGLFHPYARMLQSGSGCNWITGRQNIMSHFRTGFANSGMIRVAVRDVTDALNGGTVALALFEAVQFARNALNASNWVFLQPKSALVLTAWPINESAIDYQIGSLAIYDDTTATIPNGTQMVRTVHNVVAALDAHDYDTLGGYLAPNFEMTYVMSGMPSSASLNRSEFLSGTANDQANTTKTLTYYRALYATCDVGVAVSTRMFVMMDGTTSIAQDLFAMTLDMNFNVTKWYAVFSVWSRDGY